MAVSRHYVTEWCFCNASFPCVVFKLFAVHGNPFPGQHEERPDEYGFIARCFTRKYRYARKNTKPRSNEMSTV